MNIRIASRCKAMVAFMLLATVLCVGSGHTQALDSDIWCAAQTGDAKTVFNALQNGVDIDAKNSTGLTLLNAALTGGQSE